jgi:hypothetical protein
MGTPRQNARRHRQGYEEQGGGREWWITEALGLLRTGDQELRVEASYRIFKPQIHRRRAIQKALFLGWFDCNGITSEAKVVEVQIGCPKLLGALNGRRINMAIPGFLYLLDSEPTTIFIFPITLRQE